MTTAQRIGRPLFRRVVAPLQAFLAVVKLGLTDVPGHASAAKLLGVSVLAGIGFTVALFIATLAFAGAPELLDQAKLGILAGSLAAGIAGFAVLRFSPPVP